MEKIRLHRYRKVFIKQSINEDTISACDNPAFGNDTGKPSEADGQQGKSQQSRIIREHLRQEATSWDYQIDFGKYADGLETYMLVKFWAGDDSYAQVARS